MTDSIELLKKKIIYKSSYRGIKELDIILRSFVKKHINNLNITDLNDLFDFLSNNDDDIYKYKQGLSINKNIKDYTTFISTLPSDLDHKKYNLISIEELNEKIIRLCRKNSSFTIIYPIRYYMG